MAMKKAISIRKAELVVNNYKGDQKKLLSLIHSLFGNKKYHSVATIYQLFYFGSFNKHVFIQKIQMIKI